RGTEAWEDNVSCFRGDAVTRRILNCGERQGGEVGYICQQIQADHQNRSERQRERNITPWVDHFAGGKGDIVPRISRKERVRLRDADADKQAEPSCRGEALSNFLQSATQTPEIGKIRRARP